MQCRGSPCGRIPSKNVPAPAADAQSSEANGVYCPQRASCVILEPLDPQFTGSRRPALVDGHSDNMASCLQVRGLRDFVKAPLAQWIQWKSSVSVPGPGVQGLHVFQKLIMNGY